MPGLHPQSKRKRDVKAVEMAGRDDIEPTPWEPPPNEECVAEDPIVLPLTGADARRDRLVWVVKTHIASGRLVQFALIQQRYHRGRWREVVVVDLAHGTDVHAHRYARSTYRRVGEREILVEVRSLDDVQRGYDLAYDRVVGRWADNVKRWSNA